MEVDPEVHAFLIKHLKSIEGNDVAAYHETTSQDVSVYEWWITPHRIDGLPFHDFMMASNAARGTVFGAETQPDAPAQSAPTRFDLANLRIQRYGDTAIASYTLLISTDTAQGVRVASHNESRIMLKLNGVWRVVHVHKSPAWAAPHEAPAPK